MEVLLFNPKDESINRYYQWDSEQSIVLKSIDIGDDTYVHFCHSDSEKALVVRPYFQDGKTVVNVPNQLLQFAKPLVIYLYQVDSDTGNNTIYSTKIPVIPRPKPDTYVYTETEIIRYESLDSRILALEEAGSVDLSNYYTKDETNQLAQELVNGLEIPSEAFIYEEAIAAAEYVVDREIGDISSALDSISAIQNGLIGNTIIFYIEEIPLAATAGMTWEAWANSQKNYIGAYISQEPYEYEGVTYIDFAADSAGDPIALNGKIQGVTAKIIAGATYNVL